MLHGIIHFQAHIRLKHSGSPTTTQQTDCAENLPLKDAFDAALDRSCQGYRERRIYIPTNDPDLLLLLQFYFKKETINKLRPNFCILLRVAFIF